MQSHQTMMDVIGNNIANVNTAGFQSSRVVFSDVYYQTLSPASAATGTTGGINAAQVGYGAQIASIDVLHATGGMTTTNRTLDLYIDGDGFFVVRSGDATDGKISYTKLGNFYFDNEGNLVDSNGSYVLGSTSAIDDESTTGELEAIRISNLSEYTSISISSEGLISGVNAGGATEALAYIGLAYFVNRNGLSQEGNGYYGETANSGVADVYGSGSTLVGTIVSGALEASNVDLANEFTNMIIAQRGFQANARVITTSDGILEEVVNLKRG